MKKLILFLMILPFVAGSQTIIPITNNMVITSFSNIKFIPNNYVFTDPGLDGVIQINNVHNVVLDGTGCTVNGTNYTGYCIKINNSHHIVLKNFDSIFHYNYAVYITNSNHITIDSNKFCHNKVDSSGFIDVWADYTAALGGGVMMYQSRAADIFENEMTMQNDGVALYHCDSVKIHENNFAWNTSYGIRMFWSDTCHIYNNVANHINRPLTDPSDCAAILLIVSNKNRVENNDFSWSGDGIFLGQYQHSTILNNNYFAYNECSYSPHNAIEATFASGNVYKHNICNYSWYGFWLGYSFNTIVDSNEVNGNFTDGIAIDRGFSNSITHNTIFDNPIGIELWEGSPISGYANQHSKDYLISDNVIKGNSTGISATKTQHAVIKNNQFLYNQAAALLVASASPQDTVTENDFRMTTAIHIKNTAPDNLYAPNNAFEPNDPGMIGAKIIDKRNASTYGTVTWNPTLPGPPPAIQSAPPCDMAEPLSTWYAYPETGAPGPRKTDTLYFDSVEKQVGQASVKLVAGRGWDVALNYRPFNDSVSFWSLTSTDTLYFWVRTIKEIPSGFQYFHIRIGDYKGNYYKYTSFPSLLNAANLTWKRYQFPLSGGPNFSRSTVGNMNLDSVNYVEFHADTWDYGYTLWVDGVQFSPCDPPMTGILVNPAPDDFNLKVYPNPFSDFTNIFYELKSAQNIRLSILDISGKEISVIVDRIVEPGSYNLQFHSGNLKPGVYVLKLVTNSKIILRKLIIVR